MQKADSGLWWIAPLIAACGLAAAPGCADRSSTAAVTSRDPTSANPLKSDTKIEPKANEPVDPKLAPPNETSANPQTDKKEEPAATAAKSDSATSKPDRQKLPLRDISFDTIKFDMQKDEPFVRRMITPAIEKLDGAKIRIRGYILPSFQQTGLKQFVLVRDNMQCCFGPGAALYDCIVVKMGEGKSTDFTTRPVAVDGIFSIDELHGPDGKCLAIYHLEGQQVQ